MERIPDPAMQTILSFLEAKEVFKCACIAKMWGPHVNQQMGKRRKASTTSRKEVYQKDRDHQVTLKFDMWIGQYVTFVCWSRFPRKRGINLIRYARSAVHKAIYVPLPYHC